MLWSARVTVAERWTFNWFSAIRVSYSSTAGLTMKERGGPPFVLSSLASVSGGRHLLRLQKRPSGGFCRSAYSPDGKRCKGVPVPPPRPADGCEWPANCTGPF